MPKDKLFDGEESEDEDVSFKVDNQYAKRYDNWREKEELHKLEQKYGDKTLNSDASISSDSEDESDEPLEESEEIEAQFLKTLSLLKTKDPRIYDPSYKFFDEASENKEKVEEITEDKSKPKKAVNSLAAAFAESDEDDDNEEIFKVEKKAPVPPKKEVKLQEYLRGEAQTLGSDPAAERELAPLRALWSDPQINEGEAFLRDYILQKKYLDTDESGVGDQLRDDEALEADERTVEEQGLFERAYNFRFEEPDHEYLKRYPRTLNSIRPKDDRRARKRAEIRTRKEEEKRRKMEEIGRLKALKLKEIQEKIAKIKEVTGNEELAFKDEDLEGDFDPEEHDRRMRAIFDQHYYQGQDDRKPEFPDLDEELEIENWEKYELGHGADDEPHSQGEGGLHCEDEDFNMDADYDSKKARTTLLEEIQETLGKKRRNRKKKSKLAKLLEAEKPKFVPTVTDRTFNQYMEEYYKIDCEDVIGGDLPTRFKYREVVPNSFGLSVEEILLADDKELNQWASLKKAVRIRPENVERSELNTYWLKAQDHQLKRKMLPSLFKDIPEEPDIAVPLETVAKKKKKNKLNKEEKEQNNDTLSTDAKDPNFIENNDLNIIEQTNQNNTSDIEVPKKRKKKSKHKSNEDGSNEFDSQGVNNKRDNLIENPNESQEVTEKQGKNSKHNKPEDISNDFDSKDVIRTDDISIASESEALGTKKSKKKKKTKQNNDDLHENKINGNEIDTAVTENTEVNQQIKKKKRKHKQDEKSEIITEKKIPARINKQNTSTQKVGSKNQEINLKLNTSKANKEKVNSEGPSKSGGFAVSQSNKNKLKRKRLNSDSWPKGPFKKKAKLFKQKGKGANAGGIKADENPLSKLSDERLKAYGLNPKKYRGFLKYKKF